MKLLTIILLAFTTSFVQGAPVPLPFNFEGGSIVNGDFLNFDGGTATVIANPASGGINTSATVGQMVRNGGQPWGGAYLTTTPNMDFSVNGILCMKVYTDAPIGTQITMKMETSAGAGTPEVDAFTTVSGGWEVLAWDFTGTSAAYSRVVFLFDLGNVGNGSAASTFLFDDVLLHPTFPLSLTPGSQYFCPNASLTLTYPGAGTYNWYSDPAGATLVQATSPTYTTPVLTTSTSYYVRDMTPTPLAPAYYGPTAQGGNTSTPTTVSTFFTSNLDNGNFYAADMVQVVIGAPVPCTYTVTIFNLTQGTNRTLAWLDPSPANATRVTYTFPTPLPIFLNDQLELRIFSSGAPCYVQPTVSGNSGLFLPFPSSFNPQITFTAHTTGGVSDSQMSGMNFLMDGDFVDPALFQVNVIEDCAILPVELIDFTVQEYNGDALLNWSTASEINNDYFLLKRSADGVHWETLGTVNGNGTTVAKQNYNYRDADPLIGLSYYQLEQVDFDGTRSSSPIVTFEKSELGAVKVFPNPTSGMINISTYLDSPMNMEVRIEDMTGRLLEKHTLIGTAGVFEKEFDMQAYPSGIYSIRVYNQNESKVFKLVKN